MDDRGQGKEGVWVTEEGRKGRVWVRGGEGKEGVWVTEEGGRGSVGDRGEGRCVLVDKGLSGVNLTMMLSHTVKFSVGCGEEVLGPRLTNTQEVKSAKELVFTSQ